VRKNLLKHRKGFGWGLPRCFIGLVAESHKATSSAADRAYVGSHKVVVGNHEVAAEVEAEVDAHYVAADEAAFALEVAVALELLLLKLLLLLNRRWGLRRRSVALALLLLSPLEPSQHEALEDVTICREKDEEYDNNADYKTERDLLVRFHLVAASILTGAATTENIDIAGIKIWTDFPVIEFYLKLYHQDLKLEGQFHCDKYSKLIFVNVIF